MMINVEFLSNLEKPSEIFENNKNYIVRAKI